MLFAHRSNATSACILVYPAPLRHICLTSYGMAAGSKQCGPSAPHTCCSLSLSHLDRGQRDRWDECLVAATRPDQARSGRDACCRVGGKRWRRQLKSYTRMSSAITGRLRMLSDRTGRAATGQSLARETEGQVWQSTVSAGHIWSACRPTTVSTPRLWLSVALDVSTEGIWMNDLDDTLMQHAMSTLTQEEKGLEIHREWPRR